MQLRRWWILAAVAALALLVAACAEDDADDVDEVDDEVEEEVDEDVDVDDDEEVDEEVDEEAVDDLGLAEEGVLVAGSDLDFEPFEFIEDGEEKGFDVDLMNEIGERLGVEVEFVNSGFDTLLTQLDGGEFDVVISALTITEERAETVDFSNPYFAANQAMVVQADSGITGVEDIEGLDIGVQAATTGADYATENFEPDATVVEFPGTPEAFTALESDQVDAVFIDLPVASEQAEGSDTLELVAEVDTDEEYGIAVQMGNAALLDAINATLAEIVEDSTYETIYSEWFEGDVPEQFQ